MVETSPQPMIWVCLFRDWGCISVRLRRPTMSSMLCRAIFFSTLLNLDGCMKVCWGSATLEEMGFKKKALRAST